MNRCSCVPIKLYLHKHAEGQIWPTAMDCHLLCPLNVFKGKEILVEALPFTWQFLSAGHWSLTTFILTQALGGWGEVGLLSAFYRGGSCGSEREVACPRSSEMGFNQGLPEPLTRVLRHSVTKCAVPGHTPPQWPTARLWLRLPPQPPFKTRKAQTATEIGQLAAVLQI